MTLNSYTFPCILGDARSPCSVLQHLSFCWQPGDNSESPAFSTGPLQSLAPPFPHVPQLGSVPCMPSQLGSGARNISITVILQAARRINGQQNIKLSSDIQVDHIQLITPLWLLLHHFWRESFLAFDLQPYHCIYRQSNAAALGFPHSRQDSLLRAPFRCVVEPQHSKLLHWKMSMRKFDPFFLSTIWDPYTLQDSRQMQRW